MPDHRDLQVLDEEACWERLGEVAVVRVGVAVGGRIDVLPVNHLVHERRIYWRSAAGTKLAVAAAEAEVAVEADTFDVETHASWSVLVHGRMSIVSDAALAEQLHAREVVPWTAADQRVVWLEVEPTSVTGRVLD